MIKSSASAHTTYITKMEDVLDKKMDQLNKLERLVKMPVYVGTCLLDYFPRLVIGIL